MTLAFSLLVLAATVVRADCPRDSKYPSDIPWLECPTQVTQPACTKCGKTDVSLDLAYDLEAATLADRWAAALKKARWKVTIEITPVLKPLRPGNVAGTVTATRGHDTITARAIVGAEPGHATLAIVYRPA